MADSWEDQANAGGGERSAKLSAGAKPFVFNPNARSFTPGGAAAAAAAAAPTSSNTIEGKAIYTHDGPYYLIMGRNH